jgi:phosphotransferase system enzyme I (PtsI)
MKTERKRDGAARRGRPRAERAFGGLGVSPGVAIGAAHVVEAGFIDVPEYAIAEDAVAAEQERFADAVAKSQRQLKKLKDKSTALHGTAAEELGFLLDARLQMLTGSRVVRGVERRIAEARRWHRASPSSTMPTSPPAPTTSARSATA